MSTFAQRAGVNDAQVITQRLGGSAGKRTWPLRTRVKGRHSVSAPQHSSRRKKLRAATSRPLSWFSVNSANAVRKQTTRGHRELPGTSELGLCPGPPCALRHPNLHFLLAEPMRVGRVSVLCALASLQLACNLPQSSHDRATLRPVARWRSVWWPPYLLSRRNSILTRPRPSRISALRSSVMYSRRCGVFSKLAQSLPNPT